MIDAATAIRPNPRAAFRQLGGGEGGVVLHLDTAEYYGLNEVGALTWSLLDGDGKTFEALLSELRSRLEGEPPTLHDDIAEFLDELRARDLIELAPGAGSGR